MPPVGETSSEPGADEYEAVFVQNVAPEPDPIVEKPERLAKPAAKTGAPSLDEWQDFIARFVLRGITQGYVSLSLGDFYDELTPREREMIRLSQDELREMSAPLASLAHKSKFLQKRGRMIVASADSGEAVIALLIWMRRVNRLSKKYRKPAQPKSNQVVPGVIMEEPNGNFGPNAEQGNGDTGPTGWGIYNPGTG